MFKSSVLKILCTEFAESCSLSMPYSFLQNAQAERLFGIILPCMSAMMHKDRMLKYSFWTYATQQACDIPDFLPSARFFKANSPYHIKFRSKPEVKYLKV